MPSATSRDKARTELQKEVLDILSTQLPASDSARKNSSKLLQPGTPAAPSSSGLAKPYVLQATNSPEGTNSQQGDQNAVMVPILVDDRPASPASADKQASSASITQAWLAEMTRGPQKWGPSTFLGHCRQAARSLARVVRAHPYVLIVTLLTVAAIMAAGLAGVLAAANTETQHRKDSAQGFANNAATAFEVQLQQTLAPLVAMAAMIHLQPYYPELAKRFDEIAQELIAQVPVPGAIASLQMSPQGVVHSFYPLEGNQAALHHDLFRDPERRGAALATITNRNLTMQGPVMLLQGFRGAVARTPVFITNVSEANFFGAPDRPYNCDICYNKTTRTRFWGFVSCIVKLDNLASGKDARLVELANLGYEYEFFAPQPEFKKPIMIATSGSTLYDPVTAYVEVPNNQWTLLVAPRQGWIPSWRSPMLATVIIISAIFGGLVMATLVSRHLQLWLLKETKATNEALAAEKTRMDVLLARQYNLISCMAEQGGISGSKATSLEEKTLDRIETMRRQIGVASVAAGADQVQLHELLGEGTYGKVYKGLWRGSTVAVKTMILPAKMSGAEKRERMAIMEAAISSTMAHPNIVQTYTYTIKRATTTGVNESHTSVSDLTGSDNQDGSQADDVQNSNAFNSGNGDSSNVHSFEVNLVLEFCDWGCLRDTLDAGAFFSAGSLNYAGILDTAADVAKAMLHLHCNQVIHSDLKVRNVLLKSDGSSERGCIAKVADFGLAVKMDHQDTHVSAFQGTMSHMAPEVLLNGHISKAADVYSFGITLWELFTGCHAYHGIPRALLGHQVAVVGLRPAFPDFTPYDYRALAERCWQAEPDKRPPFVEILATLTRLRQKLGGHTPPLGRYEQQPSLVAQRERAQIHAAMALGTRSGGGCSMQEQQKKVAAAQDAGLMHLKSAKIHHSYYVDSSSGVHTPRQNGAAAAAAEPPGSPPEEFHHFSEAGAELDALQRLYEDHPTDQSAGARGVSAAQDVQQQQQQPDGTQQQQVGQAQQLPQPLYLMEGLQQQLLQPQQQQGQERLPLTPEEQRLQQQAALKLQILEQFAQQQLWVQQHQAMQQQQPQQQQNAQQGAGGSTVPLTGSFSLPYMDRRNRPKLETIADQPDAEAAMQQQHK